MNITMKLLAFLIPILFLFSCTDEKIKRNIVKEMNIKGKVRRISESVNSGVGKIGTTEKYLYEYFDKADINKIGEDSKDTSSRYDEKGNLVKENIYDFNGKLSSKMTYKYDAKGNRIEAIFHNPDDSQGDYSTFKYDDLGNLIESNNYRPDGSLMGRQTYTFDHNGFLIEETSAFFSQSNNFGKNDLSKYTYQYDEKGNMVEKRWYMSIISIQNGIIVHKSPEKLTSIFIIKYEYDSIGNWIKKSEFEDGKLISISEREIDYY